MLNMEDMISDDAKQKVQDIDQILTDLRPIVLKFVEEGFPFQPHLQQIENLSGRIEKYKRLFKISPMTSV